VLEIIGVHVMFDQQDRETAFKRLSISTIAAPSIPAMWLVQ
jgi:hypothetical protein